jgi:radical SAM superfamily enzyme YgiQ (UPF0313 family)
MQNVSIITYPTITEFTNFNSLKKIYKDIEQLSLGTLIVANLFRINGCNVNFIDSNQKYYRFIESGNNPDDFCNELAAKLAQHHSMFYGFSSICSSYHITLTLARELKREKNNCIIFLGGPQASATARATLKTCPYIDFILSGEAENSVRDFIKYYKDSPEKVPGLFWRNTDNEIKNNPVCIPKVMDQLPAPAYDLYQPVFKRSSINIEAGRGCPNNCKFCSTNHFFGRCYRLKSTKKIINEVIELTTKHKLNFVKFNHDNMFFNRERLLEFYNQWTSEGKVCSIRWSCSLRIDFITTEIADMLSKCNCHAIFIGLETGSQRMQKIINKNVDLEKAKQSIDYLHHAGIMTTVSFIIGFPEETKDDLKKTIDFFYLMLCKKLSTPQIGTLSPVAGSKYYEEYFNVLTFDNHFSSIAHQGSELSDNFTEMLKSSPELFSAHYSIPLKNLDNKYIYDTVKLLTYASSLFHYLLVISAYCVGDLYTLTILWKTYKKDNINDKKYNSNYLFYMDFLLFASKLPEYSFFKMDCKKQFMFVLDAYNLLDSEYEFLKCIKNKIKTEVTIGHNDLLEASCIMRETSFSFSKIVNSFDSNEAIEEIKMDKSQIIIFLNGDKIIVEEPSLLTYTIIHCFKDRQKVSKVLKHLCENYSHILPGFLNIEAGFLYSIETLVRRGLLAKPSSLIF